MVFTSPLILLQLGVIWGTCGLLLLKGHDAAEAPHPLEPGNTTSAYAPGLHSNPAGLPSLQIDDDRPDESIGGRDNINDLDSLLSYDPKPLIRKYMEQKRVPFLVHFTDVENLQSIIRHGILPVSDLERQNISFVRNDNDRTDGHVCAISLSIAHPNERLFYRWRLENRHRRWVVLLIDPSVLWEHPVKFCSWNAADHRERDVGQWSHQGFASLKLMFAPQTGQPSREERNLQSYDPTNVQAEALIFAPIPPEKITEAVFNDPQIASLMQAQIGHLRVSFVQDRTGVFGLRSSARALAK